MTFLLPAGIKGLTDLLETGNADKIGDFVIFHIMFQKPFRRESIKKKTVWKRMETALKWQSILKKVNTCLSMIDRENGSTVQNTEAVVRKCSLEKVSRKVLQNSEENICARISFS